MYDFLVFKNKLTKIIDHTKQEIASLRTGKASTNMLDPIKVEVYGTMMMINELASISTPDSNMLIIDPWDKSIIEAIERGINKAGLNLNPIVDRGIIRIVIPPLTEERRKELVKQLHQKAESARVMMRSARSDTKNEIEDQEGEVGVSEDDIHQDIDQLNKLMKDYEEQLEELIKSKELDLMSF